MLNTSNNDKYRLYKYNNKWWVLYPVYGIHRFDTFDEALTAIRVSISK